MNQPSTPPAFQLYARDWLEGTADMSNEEAGAYMRLLCHSWIRDGLPNDPEKLSRMAGALPVPSLGQVLAKFRPQPDGKLRNQKQEFIRAETIAYRARQSEKGRKGAAAKHRHSTGSSTGSSTGTAQAVTEAQPEAGSASAPASAKVLSPSEIIGQQPEQPERPERRLFFRKPSRELFLAYAETIKLPEVEAEKCYDYYESNGWKVGKNQMRDWQAAARNWKKNIGIYEGNASNNRQRPSRSKGTLNETVSTEAYDALANRPPPSAEGL